MLLTKKSEIQQPIITRWWSYNENYISKPSSASVDRQTEKLDQLDIIDCSHPNNSYQDKLFRQK